MNILFVQFSKNRGWFSGDVSLMSEVFETKHGFKGSNDWRKVKSARTREEFFENIAEIFPGTNIIKSEEFL